MTAGDASVQQTSQAALNATTQAHQTPNKEKMSVDQLEVADAVASLAEATELPSAGDLREATTSLQLQKQLAQADTEVISKPQLIQPETSAQRGITEYVAKEGEDLNTIAAKFKISSQTLRWANNMTSDAVEPNRKLVVPQVDGVVYSIKDGDTIAALAEKYKADAERVVLYNALDRGAQLTTGLRIVLPGGQLPENERPGYTAPGSAGRYGSIASRGGTSGASYGNFAASVGNRYAPGNCTWYSYERRLALGRPIGSFWGNANTWAASARAAGFTVNNTPAVGAIFQDSSGYYGHVGIVERVENGRVFVSDMNYAGYNVITHRELSNPGAYNYIH